MAKLKTYKPSEFDVIARIEMDKPLGYAYEKAVFKSEDDYMQVLPLLERLAELEPTLSGNKYIVTESIEAEEGDIKTAIKWGATPVVDVAQYKKKLAEEIKELEAEDG